MFAQKESLCFPSFTAPFVSLKLSQFSASINELRQMEMWLRQVSSELALAPLVHCPLGEQWRKEYNFIKAFQMRKEADSLPFYAVYRAVSV